ncbi:MAG: UDP-N-acetylglucosamine 2-epimerase (non-hydrolyzing) [Lentimicrobiaceae bacterium]|jgi:UDP-GlcNAc3NAcA epimerase|nr:UDP-N-acetylglucosamine 2-epimerase (non-hydrolyzing) [Lentimicrobiaceae bacterium]MBT3453966.1 UDP-N-acetylglucosamine 2-epimerase (non-hydrolyzing) [Lentimicrobiaceae bacterium]MBT3818577.1 UDP-N-acetylglucosamine 2-epimerase (non-hydrolyzing) [Lentimicrobiaceae bacterium]MBT4061927.1 UDP-N-acetylglucosamine 2-epimerase (non-hydrolyzing) [Lentimicrobiaceae bacterium]MBT4191094.1 UDP-N-acetylglucosamine 2-epimerase (non-hydrolyzing) [Lentimicrobiaceae bacterium]
MLKIVTIIGARPQIIKAAALSRAIKNHFANNIKEIIVHTGQHYDTNMSQVFIDELGIPQPDYNLNVGSGGHASQTSDMIIGIEGILQDIKPDYLVLYGDTNSTIAGALAASKIHIPIVHIEAGLRSFNKLMPEEINRIMCDHTSTLLFSPTLTGYNNLINEGFETHNTRPYTADKPGVFHCGDVMYDNSLYFAGVAEQQSRVIEDNNLIKNKFILSTIHRNNNTDDPERLSSIFEALNHISSVEETDIILPLHPRTSKIIEQNLDKALYSKLIANPHLKIVKPVSFLDMIALEKNCSMVITDSGGVQKEAYYFKKPCVILRSETEWVEIVNQKAARIANADKELIIESYHRLSEDKNIKYPEIFGDGKASEFICQTMLDNQLS